MQHEADPPRLDAEALRNLAAVTRGHRWAVPVLVVLGLLSALTEGLGIGLMIPLFAAIFGHAEEGGRVAETVGRIAGDMSEDERVALLVGLILALAALRSMILFSYDALAIRVSGRVTHRLRMALYDRLLEVGYAFFAHQNRGRLFDIVRGDTWYVGELLMAVSRGLSSVCAIAVFGALLLAVSPWLTAMAAAGAVVIALLVRLVALRVRAYGRATVETSATLSRRTMEALGAMRTIRLFCQEAREHERFRVASERDRAAAERVEIGGALIQPATELLYAPLFLAILLAAWASEMTFPTLVAYMVLLYRLQPHARRLDHLRVEIAGQLPVVENILWLMRREGKPFVAPGTRPFDRLRRGVRFEGVSFAYGGGEDGRRHAVSDLTFVIPKDRVTAFVGESGAGKSTVVNLLFRLYDPAAGRILVDGTPLDELDLAAWRRRLAFAGQDTELVGDTVREAVAFGRPDADAEAVETAARRAHADAFIRELPQGYDTPLGDGGLRLSAGQRQRIALARALLVEPDILVLDEATSALDSLSESLIQDALSELSGRMTMVIVAHRLSTIRDADTVVVLGEGRVTEQGPPRDLLAREHGAFARLWKLQSAAFAEETAAGADRSGGRKAAAGAGR